MIPYLGCEVAREMLAAFVDGELPLAEQVAVESHLRWCRTCVAHVEDLRAIGDALRAQPNAGAATETAGELAALQAGVLSRVRAEREQSFTAQMRELFEDMHLLWAGLGATAAVLICLFATVGVMHAASEERPDSLAGIIDVLANPGSDRNPIRLDSRIAAPRSLPDAPALDSMPEEDAVFALAAVVTREGRIANYELLLSELSGSSRQSRAEARSDVLALLDAVARSRFSPAQAGGAPVAVNMVWLLARTTVKGSPRALDFETPRWRDVEAIPASPVPEPAVETPEPSVPSLPDARSSTV